MVEEMLAARGINVSHETVRQWALKFGQEFANQIRGRRLTRAGDKWRLDEVAQNRRREALVVASRGSDRHCSRRSCSEPSRQTSHQAAAPEAAETPDAAASGHDHRQVRQLWGGKEGGDARR
jgi:hypothetical protein